MPGDRSKHCVTKYKTEAAFLSFRCLIAYSLLGFNQPFARAT